MDNIRLSHDLLRVEGAKTVIIPNERGQKEYYVAVPCSKLYIPNDNRGGAFLISQLIETTNNQYAQFGIKPYVSPQEWQAMSEEQRRAIGFIGSGRYIQRPVPTSLTQSAQMVQTVSATEIPATPTMGQSSATPSDVQFPSEASNAPY